MRYSDIITERNEFYDGPPLESGGTSIRGKGVDNAAPGVKWLFTSGKFADAETILDYGAGKYARNANFLRNQGFKVYAYDPFNGTDVSGWEGVSIKLPSEKFDSSFSAYVLNVVPEKIETDIINDMSGLSNAQFHITRNSDIRAMARKAVMRNDRHVMGFINDHFAEDDDLEKIQMAQESGDWKMIGDLLEELVKFGLATSSGFQRVPFLEEKGFSLIKNTSGFKIYGK